MWLNINKPSGIASFDVIRTLRRILPAKMGYAGTLDPLATGVLPLAFDQSTKQIPHLMRLQKSYRFTVLWGQQTISDDITGEVISQSDQRPTREAIEALLPQFHGTLKQIPPVFSAIKVRQKRAYQRAANQETFAMPPRWVDVYTFRIEEHSPDRTTFFVACESGTYVRSLARDLGAMLGCLGTVETLHRVHVGPFTDTDAIPLIELTNEEQIRLRAVSWEPGR